ncbi:MAG: MBL fold metallo-hydrolase [Anaerolineaceae bacterium]|nr:MBL fold metallo-hydrolase [Anaerolineaceae bacterium]
MELTWYGHSCVRISERNMATVVCDPFDTDSVGFSSLKLKADIVTISHDSPGHNHLEGVKGEPFIIKGPGEYEIGGVFITGATDKRRKNASNEEDKPRNTIYVIEYNGINIAHMGNIDVVPSQNDIESLGPINIALIPVGGKSSVNAAKAVEIVSLLDPQIVIPIHYGMDQSKIELDSVEKFSKEMGVTSTPPIDVLKLNGSKDLPQETQVIILTPKS